MEGFDPARVENVVRARSKRRVSDNFVLLLAGLFASVSVLLIASVAALRLPTVDAWIAERVHRELLTLGIPATMGMHVELLPPRIVLTNVVIPSLDGSDPALSIPRLEVRPRLSPLIVGRFLVDELRVERPHVRVVVAAGEVKNLSLPHGDGKKSPGVLHLPIRTLAVTDATLDLDIEGDLFVINGLDADARLTDDPTSGMLGHVALDADESWVIRHRRVPATEEHTAYVARDDDILCRLSARVTIDATDIVLRRLLVDGLIDREPSRSERVCNAAAGDPRWVRVSLTDTAITRKSLENGPPVYHGEGVLRAPLALANRFAPIDAAGIFETTFKVHSSEGHKLPDLEARVSGSGIALGKFEFVDRLDGDLRIQNDVVSSSSLSISVGQGVALLRDVSVAPFAPGIPLHARLNGDGIDFLSLMQALGVSPHPHVAWQVQSLVVGDCSGTLSPLNLNGPIEIGADSLGVYDRAVDDPSAKRVVGLGATRIAGQLHLDDHNLVFERLHVSFGRSSIRGAQVRIGFAGGLQVDADALELDLADVGTVAGMPVSGVLSASVHVHGANGDPLIEVQATGKDLEFGGIALGHVEGIHARSQSLKVDLGGFTVKRGGSSYHVAQMLLDFSKDAALVIHGQLEGESVGLRDLLATFHLDDDPRFDGFDARLGLEANLRVDLGGPLDRCGGGVVAVHVDLRAEDVLAFQEHFDRGSASVDLAWTDRSAGLSGATLRVGSFRLEKADIDDHSRTVGRLAGAVEMAFGGELDGKFFLDATPMRRFDKIRQLAPAVDGFVSGHGTIGGRIDALELEGLFDVEQTLVDGIETGPSHVAWHMGQSRGEPGPTLTHCGLAISSPFDRAAYIARRAPSGLHRIDGSLFGGQLLVRDAQLTVENSPMLIGEFDLRDLDVARVALPLFTPAPISETDAVEGIEAREATEGTSASNPWSGRVTGLVRVASFRASEWAKANVSIDLTQFRFSSMGILLTKGDQPVKLQVADGRVLLGQTHVRLLAADESSTTAIGMSLAIENLGARGTVRGHLEVPSTALGTFASLDARLRRAKGTVAGEVEVYGDLASPAVAGSFHLDAEEIPLGEGVPSLRDVRAEFTLSPNRFELTKATARTSGGDLDASGAVILSGFEPVRAEAVASVRGVRFSPIEGTRASIDGRFDIVVPTFRHTGERARIGGEITLRDAEYVRSINLATGFAANGAGRRSVDHYDPANDWLDLDVQVKTGTPIRIHNNLVEVLLETGKVGLRVTGTNQRFGLRGELNALSGGRFHFPTNDFDVRTATVRFDDPTRVAPMVDVSAYTEYRRFSEKSATGTGSGSSSTSTTQGSSTWRIDMRASGDASDLRLAMTSDPPLAQDDIVLLLTMGITRTELDQLRSGAAIGALGALGTLSGADRAVKDTIRVLDDFRLGAGYSPRAARTVPQITIGKRLSDSVRATVTTGISESSDVRSIIEWAFGKATSAQASYDNYTTAASASSGNLGLDLKWRLEFE